jgi:hypothetical protein
MRLIKDYEVNILKQEMQLDCTFRVSIRQKEAKKVIGAFEEVYGIERLKEDDL